MTKLPTDLKYARTHEWVRAECDGATYTVGITEYAQKLLGDIVYVELPDIEDLVEKGEDVSVVESVKAAADVYSPLEGVVIELNYELKTDPALINTSPYKDGWIFRIESDKPLSEDLLDAEAYELYVVGSISE